MSEGKFKGKRRKQEKEKRGRICKSLKDLKEIFDVHLKNKAYLSQGLGGQVLTEWI